ncbi:MAG: PD-(D/E)XK nuclease family protein [Rhodocyclales bacterium]|nr:PD-(D/E)XK nuclease family protein [Rhodocyclales bacterium]
MPEAARPVITLRIPASADFVACCAQRIVETCRSQLPDLSALLIVLPGPALAPGLRQALAAAAGRALLLPRIATLAQLAAAANAGGQPDSQRQLALYRQLRERAWFADSALWEICAELIALFDELNERAIGLPEDEAVLLARLERAYDARGSQLLRFEAEVVHRLWRAEASGPPGRHAAMAMALALLADKAATPLFMLCEGEPRPIEAAFRQAWAARQPVTVFQPQRAAADAPLMQALNFVWPPDAGEPPPLAGRADAARAALPESPLAGRLRLIGAASLEEEAAAVASEVKRWLASGRKSIALVAADRVAARRARALLERNGILVQDETGWKLSTTRAAALVDAWLEVVAADAYHRDLLDLVKSPFVFGDLAEEGRQAGLLQLEDGLARHNLAYGLGRYEAVLAREAGYGEAVALLKRVAVARRAMPRGSASIADWLAGLEQALGELGALPGLAGDEAGATLIELLRLRREELLAVPGRLTFGEWREWLNRELENAAFVDRGIDSPLVMTHLAATRLRRFDAAVLIGVDRDNLAPALSRAVFSNQAVRSDLGLSLPAEAAARLRDDLAGLIASCGEVTATWQTVRGDEANLLCPELSLLSVLHERAWGDDLVMKPDIAAGAAVGQQEGCGTAMPCPAAPQRVPLRLSASAYASLMACPYQFFARRMLGLAEAEEVREALEKRDYGEFVHRILRRFHAEHPRFPGRPDEVLTAALEAISREVFAPEIEENFLEHAWLARWIECVPGYIAWQKAREAGGWRCVGGELARERGLPLAGGGELVLHGRLDRLDRRADGSEAVLDYKTQDAQGLKRRLAEPSEDVQLACYALLQGERVGEAAYVALDGEKTVELPLPDVQEMARAQGARLAAAIDALRAGAALPAHGVDAACAWCEMRGLCRRDYHNDLQS